MGAPRMDWINKKLIAECLKELSDKSYQERVWLASSGPEISSLTEATNQLFGDSGMHVYLEKNNQIYNKEIDDRLKELGNMLAAIPDNRHPSELIKDEKMVPVRKMAADILDLIERQEHE